MDGISFPRAAPTNNRPSHGAHGAGSARTETNCICFGWKGSTRMVENLLGFISDPDHCGSEFNELMNHQLDTARKRRADAFTALRLSAVSATL